MKIHVDVDVTPEEMRRLVGLPDVESFNRELLDQIREKMLAGVEGYEPLSLFQPYFSSTKVGMDVFRKMMEATMAGFVSGGRKDES